LLLKDMNLGKSLAEASHAPTPLTKQTVDLYQRIAEKGWGDRDFSIAYKYFKELEQ
jgi:3-hydroxyisobutyrate dehydrogenase-like beta-hydroxyacid dehydrogenase